MSDCALLVDLVRNADWKPIRISKLEEPDKKKPGLASANPGIIVVFKEKLLLAHAENFTMPFTLSVDRQIPFHSQAKFVGIIIDVIATNLEIRE